MCVSTVIFINWVKVPFFCKYELIFDQVQRAPSWPDWANILSFGRLFNLGNIWKIKQVAQNFRATFFTETVAQYVVFTQYGLRYILDNIMYNKIIWSHLRVPLRFVWSHCTEQKEYKKESKDFEKNQFSILWQGFEMVILFLGTNYICLN